MIRIDTIKQEVNGLVFTIDMLCLYVQGCRFILAINESIEVTA